MSNKTWQEYVADEEADIDMGTGEILDRTNWPRIYEAKLLMQRLAAAGDLGEEEESLIEGLNCFLDAVQDYAEDALGVPGHLVFLHRNPDHYNSPEYKENV